jgi:hypothetical protein
LTLAFGLSFSSAHSASSQALMKAKKEAEAKGYIFALNHDEIVAKAKKEGRLRVLSRLDPTELKPGRDFQDKYPFTEIRAEEIGSRYVSADDPGDEVRGGQRLGRQFHGTGFLQLVLTLPKKN